MFLALRKITRKETMWYMNNFKTSWGGVRRVVSNKLILERWPSTSKFGSLGRLNNLIRNLSQNKQFETYSFIKELLDSGIVEKVDENSVCGGKEYYIPHKAVGIETAQTISVRMVYGTSTKSSQGNISLNYCLKTGPPPRNPLWHILLRTRFQPILLGGDIQKAFFTNPNRES